MSDVLLAVEGLSVHFGGVRAVDDVTLAVRRGSVTALIGPNGAGKTTCFNVISGIQAPTRGTVRYKGRDVTRLPPFARRGIGRTFQIVQLFGEMTVIENVLVGLQRTFRGGLPATALRWPGLKAQETRAAARARELLCDVGLEGVAERPAGTLSLGQQRLLELARALAGDPELILLDEASSGLSPAEIDDFVARVQGFNGRGGTVLLVEHNMRFVNRLASDLVVLNYGKIIFDGAPGVGMRDPAVVSAYLGSAARA
jgi:ABC-type branched-subunit amino acid transport system ATPase component